MALLTWGDQFKVNIAEIDNQHRKLFDMVNEMHDAMKAGKASEVTGKILVGLVDYTKMHFAVEEKYMSQYNYPEYSKHKAEHDALTKKATDLLAQHKEGKPVLSFDLMDFLKKWLTDHILITDKKYGPFLNSKGIK